MSILKHVQAILALPVRVTLVIPGLRAQRSALDSPVEALADTVESVR
jgi:hypothetical protein